MEHGFIRAHDLRLGPVLPATVSDSSASLGKTLGRWGSRLPLRIAIRKTACLGTKIARTIPTPSYRETRYTWWGAGMGTLAIYNSDRLAPPHFHHLVRP